MKMIFTNGFIEEEDIGYTRVHTTITIKDTLKGTEKAFPFEGIEVEKDEDGKYVTKEDVFFEYDGKEYRIAKSSNLENGFDSYLDKFEIEKEARVLKHIDKNKKNEFKNPYDFLNKKIKIKEKDMEKKYWDQNGERNDLLIKFEKIAPNRGSFEGELSTLNKVLETQSVYYGFFNDGLCNHISIDEDGDISHNYRDVDIKLYKEIENIMEKESISEENIIDSKKIERVIEYALTRALEEQEELINEVYNNKTFVIEGFPKIKNITKKETVEELGIYNVTLQMCDLEPGEELSLEIKNPKELQNLIFSDYYREVLTVETKGDQITSYKKGIEKTNAKEEENLDSSKEQIYLEFIESTNSREHVDKWINVPLNKDNIKSFEKDLKKHSLTLKKDEGYFKTYIEKKDKQGEIVESARFDLDNETFELSLLMSYVKTNIPDIEVPNEKEKEELER